VADELIGERSQFVLNYPTPVDPENIGRVVGPDIWGAPYTFVGVEGRKAYFKVGA
jgi:hypothetical protein